MDIIIGSHVSFNKKTQLVGSVLEALSYGSNTFMFYTGAPQNTVRADLDIDNIIEAHNLMKEKGINIENVVIHAPYIINLANKKNREFNIEFLKKEIKRTEVLGVKRLVIHPGSHVGYGVFEGIINIADVLNTVIDEKTNVEICLETMAGKGTELGRTFEEISEIISQVECKDKVKVCLDTCHINDAGYSLDNFDEILNQFDSIIGLEKLSVVHINDSKNVLGARKDRHENIGYGTIGFDNLINVIYNERIKDVPKILETPYIDGNAPYLFEIEMIKKKTFNNHLIQDCKDYNKS